jgi:hypothetical protein
MNMALCQIDALVALGGVQTEPKLTGAKMVLKQQLVKLLVQNYMLALF